MPEEVQTLILPLILLIVSFVLIALAVFIIASNKNSMKTISTSVDNDYKNYKKELKEQNESFMKQVLNKLSENNASGGITKENYSPEKDLMNIFVKLKGATKENCVNAMNQIGAARIAIYLFHNGVHSTHGINFIKVSCMCEKVAIGSGVRERMVDHSNLPINLFDEMIDKLINNNRYIIHNDESIQETSHKMFISADKINYTQLVTIYDLNNNLLGFVAAEIDRPYSKEEVDKEKEVLDDLVRQLIPVLSYSDYSSIRPL